MPLHAKLSLFAYIISGERSANRPKKLRNDAFQVKTSQSAKNQLDPAKNENRPKKRYTRFLHEALQLFCDESFICRDVISRFWKILTNKVL